MSYTHSCECLACTDLRAENAQLRAERDRLLQASGEHLAQRCEYYAEAQRLREALEEIAAQPSVHPLAAWAHNRARQALAAPAGREGKRATG